MKAAFRRLVRPILELQVKRLVARHNLKVVAVAGSVGKTTTKTAIATVLSQKYRVLNQTGYFSNFNSEIGLPLSVFELEVPSPIINPFAWIWRLIQTEVKLRGNYPYQVLVLELGSEHPGELDQFMKYLTPDFGVVTAIAPEHMEFFKTIEAVAEEEFIIAKGSKQAILNDTFDRLHPLAKTLKVEPIWYSAKTIEPINKKHFNDTGWPLLTVETVNQALGAAVVVGEALKLNATQIADGIKGFKGVAGRMQHLEGLGHATIIDDTYNSSPDAAIAALNYLQNQPSPNTKIAIMGSMNELGDDSARYHEEVGRAAAGVDWLVTIGPMANKHLGPAAVSAGLDPTRFKPADSPYAAGEFVKLLLDDETTVLAKGSQNGVFAEEAVKMLLANPADASKLVRQSPSWLAKKRAQFPDAPQSFST